MNKEFDLQLFADEETSTSVSTDLDTAIPIDMLKVLFLKIETKILLGWIWMTEEELAEQDFQERLRMLSTYDGQKSYTSSADADKAVRDRRRWLENHLRAKQEGSNSEN